MGLTGIYMHARFKNKVFKSEVATIKDETEMLKVFKSDCLLEILLKKNLCVKR